MHERPVMAHRWGHRAHMDGASQQEMWHMQGSILRTYGCSRPEHVCVRLLFLTVLCLLQASTPLPPSVRFLTVLSVVQAALSFPNTRARLRLNSPDLLQNAWDTNPLPAPDMPVPAHLTHTCRRPPRRWSLSLWLCRLSGCLLSPPYDRSETASGGNKNRHVPIWVRPTMRLYGSLQLKEARDTCS